MILESALLCLATNIFHEARGEQIPGQYAVAQVTMTRARGDQALVCSQVYKKDQFSWTRDRTKRQSKPWKINPQAWATAKIVARTVLSGRATDITRGATHYHATYVQPKWAHPSLRTKRIGAHVFYKLA